jgi:transcriptional regulator with XRE-family HTH domain
MSTHNSLGDFIRNYVTAHSITINDLARSMDIHHSTIARWANGKTEPSLKQLAKLADATSTDLCFLVEVIYPQPRRSVNPNVRRLAETIGNLSVEAQEMVDSILLGLSLKNTDKDSHIR